MDDVSDVDVSVATLKSEFRAAVDCGDKERVEAIYQEVYELREYMNRVHAGTVWRREIPKYPAGSE